MIPIVPTNGTIAGGKPARRLSPVLLSGVAPIDPRTVADGGVDALATRFAAGNNSQSFMLQGGSFGVVNNGGFLQFVGVGPDHGMNVGDWVAIQGPDIAGYAIASTVRSVEDPEIFTANWPYGVVGSGKYYKNPPTSGGTISVISPAVGVRYFYEYGGGVWTTGQGFSSGIGMTAWLRDVALPFKVHSLLAVVNLSAFCTVAVAGVPGANQDALYIHHLGGQLQIVADGVTFAFPTAPGTGKKLVAIRFFSGLVWQVRYTGSGGWLTTTMTTATEFNISTLLSGGEEVTTAPSGLVAACWSEGVAWSDATFDGLAAFYQAQADVAVGW